MHNSGWDNDYNDRGEIKLTLYMPDMYDNWGERKRSFDIKYMKEYLLDAKEYCKEYNEDEDFTIGLDSDSLNKPNRHNIFLEWDKKYGLPDINKLKDMDGIISKTDNGYHFLHEAEINTNELIKLQHAMKCCKGFIDCSKKKKYSCLRIAPKENNLIRIIKGDDSLLYNVYRQFIIGLGGKDETK